MQKFIPFLALDGIASQNQSVIKRYDSVSRQVRVAQDRPCVFTRDQKLRRDYQISMVEPIDNKLNR